MRPACEIPGMASGPMFIVNLQPTPKDAQALRSGGLLIRGRIDDVMRLVMVELDMAEQVNEVCGFDVFRGAYVVCPESF